MVDTDIKDMQKLKVKDLRTNKTCEFKERWEAAWFVGTSLEEMERLLELFEDEAMVYCVGDEEYVIECDGRERAPTLGRHTIPIRCYAEVVSSTGHTKRFETYISIANYLGLLVGHVIWEKARNDQGFKPNVYVNDEGRFTIEFKRFNSFK